MNYGLKGYVLSSGSQSVGVVGQADCANCIGVNGTSGSGTGVSAYGGGAGINASTASTGAGTGVYGSITGHDNTGYAGYFVNTDTNNASNTNYGIYVRNLGNYGYGIYSRSEAYYSIYGISAGGSSAAIQGENQSGGTGIYGLQSAVGATGYAGYFSNVSTGAGYGVYGTITGHGNTGYAGYFKNTDTGPTKLRRVWHHAQHQHQSAGIYGECDSGNCQGVSGFSSNGTASPASAATAQAFRRTGTNGYGVVGAGNWPVSSATPLASTGVGVHGNQYAQPTPAMPATSPTPTPAAINFGVYGIDHSSTGYGVNGYDSKR